MPFTNQITLNEFIDLFQTDPGRVIPFLGAGMAAPLFPSWETLLIKLLETAAAKSSFPYDKAQLLERIKNGQDYLDIADICANLLGKNSYRSILEEVFDAPFDFESIPKQYQALFNLKPAGVLTTNYDQLPELASKGTYRIFTNKNISEGQRAFEKGKKCVFKIHGDIKDHESIILGNKDYDQIVFQNPSAENFLRSMFSTRTILFLGFGLTDPHFDLILKNLHAINSGIPVTHYALLAASDRFKIDAIELKYGVRVISYIPSDKTHPEVLEFIHLLGGAGKNESTATEITLEDIQEISHQVNTKLVDGLGSHHFLINFEEDRKRLFISYSTRSATPLEMQNEILKIARTFNFATSLINSIVVTVHEPLISMEKFDDSFPIVIGCTIPYASAKKFSMGNITDSEIWKEIEFFVPRNVGTLIRQSNRITVNHIGGLNENKNNS